MIILQFPKGPNIEIRVSIAEKNDEKLTEEITQAELFISNPLFIINSRLLKIIKPT